MEMNSCDPDRRALLVFRVNQKVPRCRGESRKDAQYRCSPGLQPLIPNRASVLDPYPPIGNQISRTNRFDRHRIGCLDLQISERGGNILDIDFRMNQSFQKRRGCTPGTINDGPAPRVPTPWRPQPSRIEYRVITHPPKDHASMP